MELRAVDLIATDKIQVHACRCQRHSQTEGVWLVNASREQSDFDFVFVSGVAAATELNCIYSSKTHVRDALMPRENHTSAISAGRDSLRERFCE